MRKPVWQRLLIMVAGPAANLVLPFVLYTGAMMLGEPQPDNEVGAVMPGSAAAESGLQPGDAVVQAAGLQIDTWYEFIEQADAHVGGTLPLTVERRGARHDLSLTVPEITKRTGYFDYEALGLGHDLPSSIVGVRDPDSPAGRSGLRTGDLVVGVDERPVQTWYELDAALSDGASHEVDVLRAVDGEPVEASLTLTGATPAGSDLLATWGIEYPSLYVGRVAEGSAAEAAGVQVGDRMVAIDDTVLEAWYDVVDAVGKTVDAGGEPRTLDLHVVRAGEDKVLTFRPTVERELILAEIRYRPIMGVLQYGDLGVPGAQIDKRYGLTEAVPRATDQGTRLFRDMVKMLGNLFTGKVMPQESVGGPVEIFRQAKQSAELGVFAYVRMMGMISISLGIINLLPVPVLDGGQILFYSIEGIRGRPLPLALRERIQMVGVLALMALMLTVTVMDVSRWLGG
jgi:regulator of sigma E protease